jgi:hypothetical protein
VNHLDARVWIPCFHESNKLVEVWANTETGERRKQGKRVGKDCPLDYNLRRIYVKEGKIGVLRYLTRNLGMTLLEAVDTVYLAEHGTKRVSSIISKLVVTHDGQIQVRTKASLLR